VRQPLHKWNIMPDKWKRWWPIGDKRNHFAPMGAASILVPAGGRWRKIDKKFNENNRLIGEFGWHVDCFG